MIGRLSKARFDITFGPHRFRHAIATTAPLHAPEYPGLAAPLLIMRRPSADLEEKREPPGTLSANAEPRAGEK
jgi:hypothetical protein